MVPECCTWQLSDIIEKVRIRHPHVCHPLSVAKNSQVNQYDLVFRRDNPPGYYGPRPYGSIAQIGSAPMAAELGDEHFIKAVPVAVFGFKFVIRRLDASAHRRTIAPIVVVFCQLRPDGFVELCRHIAKVYQVLTRT